MRYKNAMDPTPPTACRRHEDAPAIARCAACGAGVCAECMIEERGVAYCKACYRAAKLATLEGARDEGAERAPEAPPSAPAEPPGFVRTVLNLCIGGLGGGFAAFAAAAGAIRYGGLGGGSVAEAEQLFYVFAITGVVAGMVAGVALRETRRALVLLAAGFALSLLSLGTMKELAAERAAGFEGRWEREGP